MARITGLKASIIGFEGERKGGSAGPNLGTNHIQQVGDRIKLDCTPDPDSGDPNDPNLIRFGTVPKITVRWGRKVEGHRIFNSKGGDGQLDAGQDERDHWSLESYERKGPQDTSGPGLTPVLLQEEAFGEGTTECFAYFCIEAAYNDGLDVRSNEVTWKAD